MFSSQDKAYEGAWRLDEIQYAWDVSRLMWKVYKIKIIFGIEKVAKIETKYVFNNDFCHSRLFSKLKQLGICCDLAINKKMYIDWLTVTKGMGLGR